MSGIGVLQTIRSRSNVPVIVLSIQTAEDHKVHFLRSGADDYVIKPFGIAELAARCEAVLRRYHTAVGKGPVVRTGRLTIDLVPRSATLDDRYVTLTRQEYRLLHLLASHLGLVITHNQLISDIWGDTSSENVQYLRSLLRNRSSFFHSNVGVTDRRERPSSVTATSGRILGSKNGSKT